MSTAFRVLLGLAAAAVLLLFLVGPAWRGSFYRSWLRPRLVVFGILVAVLAVGDYVYRIVNALRSH